MAKKKSETPKGKDLFEFIDGIYTDQRPEFFDSLTDGEKKKYKNSKYMIHRFLSMNPMLTPIVNAVQKYTNMPERAHYLFLSSMIPRGKQYNKYIKGQSEDKYEDWLIQLVANHYHISWNEAIVYLNIYCAEHKDALRSLCEKYGIDKKQLKSAKLI